MVVEHDSSLEFFQPFLRQHGSDCFAGEGSFWCGMSVSNQVIKILAYAHSNVDTYLRFYSGLKLGVVVTRQILFQSMGAPAHSVAGEDPSWLARHSSLCPSSHTSNSSLVSPVEVLQCSSHVVNGCEHGSLSQSLVVDLVGAGG